MRHRGVLLAAGLVLISASAHGSTGSSTVAAEPEEPPRAFRITPIVAPGYTPELELTVAAGALMSFSPDPSNEKLPRSSLPVALGISTNGSFIGFARLSSFWLDDFLRFNADVWFKDQPDHYFGVGYESGRALEQGSDTAYDRRWWQFVPTVLFRLYGHFYAGAIIDLNRTKARNVNPVMAMDPDYVEFGADNFNFGLGATLQVDTRDVPVNAYNGYLLSVAFVHHDESLGSHNTYEILDFDYRHALEVVRPGSTLVWQVRSRHGIGDVPWGELSMVGSPFDLRGYRWGRFRDNTSLYGLVEYRAMFEGDRKSWVGLGRFGIVFWAGAGSVGEDYGDLSNWLPNWGLGGRFELQDRLNLRLDLGFGDDSTAFYLNFNEAF